MKKRLFWVGFCFLIIGSMILSSCSSSTTPLSTTTSTSTVQPTSSTIKPSTTSAPATTQATTTTTQASATPTYGGTLTLFTTKSDHNPTGWDIPMTVDLGAAAVWCNPFLEWLTTGDIQTYGPGGSNAYSFQTYEVVPEQYLTGVLAKSWEATSNPLTYVFHLRQGIMWTGNQKIGMAPRELVASDVVASELRSISRPGFASSFTWIKSITAPDKYTVVWTLNSFFANWPWRIGCGTALGAVMAPETVTAGPNDWRNQTGTGPYILSDYVDGGGATYTRNVNYWGTATISGKSYQLPFIDKVIYPVIPDQSTQIAALRTGKIDWDPLVKQTYTASLTQSSPALIQKQYLSGQMLSFRFNRIKSKYFSDKNLRRAMMIGTDLNSIAKLIYGGGEVVDYPLSSLVPGYTPLDQMPASQKELYTYDPVKAKALIAAAGYPAGFKVIISTGSDATSTDIANLCVSMWSQIGVTATIQILDSTAMATANNDVSFPDGLLNSGADVNPFVVFNDARNDLANPTYTKTEATDFTTPYYVAMGTVDPVQRTALIKDLNLKILDDVPKIPFTNAYALDCYWPWLKNYYGEVEASYYNQMPMVKIMWIDQNLKKSLGK